MCADNGLTFANECLAECSGASVAHAGLCDGSSSSGALSAAARGAGGPGSPAAAARAAAAAAAAESHPVACFIAADPAAAAARAGAGSSGGGIGPAGRGTGGSSSSAPAAAPLVATAADIRRFSAEGMVLIGAAKLGKPSGEKLPPRSKGDRCGWLLRGCRLLVDRSAHTVHRCGRPGWKAPGTC